MHQKIAIICDLCGIRIYINNNELVISKFRFARLILGASPSQYLLNTVIRKHVQKYQSEDPEFIRRVLHSFYVDDLLPSLSDTKDGFEFYMKCKIRFTEANFNLRKWRTNDSKLRAMIASNEVRDRDKSGNVLGIRWEEEQDLLVVTFKDYLENAVGEDITKRQILKVVAAFYDPLGLIQPFVVQLKIFISRCVDYD